MPAKTIYVKEEDLPIFERAEELGGDSLSGIIATSLKRFVAAKEAEGKGIREHTLTVGVIRPQGADDVQKIRFYGRELASGRTYSGQTSSGDDRGTDYTIYQTETGKIVVYWRRWSKWQGENQVCDYAVLDSLPGYKQPIVGETTETIVEVPGSLLRDAADTLGQELVTYIQ
jgi:EXLDI family protein